MSGKRLLDVAAIINATRVVAKKHVDYRAKQFDFYIRTSSLARAIRAQTDRVTQTISAASILASRINDLHTTDSSEASHNNDSSRNYSDNYFHESSSQVSFPNESLKSPLHGLPIETEVSLGIRKEIGKTSDHTSSDKSKSNKSAEPVSVSLHDLSPRLGYFNEDISCNRTDKPHPDVRVISKGKEVPDNTSSKNFHDPKVSQLLDTVVQENQSAALEVKAIKNKENDGQKSSIIVEEDKYHASRLTASQNELRPELRRENSENGTSSDQSSFKLRESRVPASRVARLWNYGSLAVGIFSGVVREGFRRASGGESDGGSYILNANNMNRLVDNLSRMRGAALKIGQMISFQDSSMFPTPVQEALQRVQDRADYMPQYQRDKVLKGDLGSDWRDLFASFDEIPLAAASIGQVHRAVLKSNGAQVAVKVQYPGVAESIDSDLKNISILLTASKLLPKGLFLDKTIANARTELAWECDYIREAECAHRFRKLLKDDDTFTVPKIYSEASGKQVLTMEFMNGVAITKIKDLTQEQKDWIGTQILRLCLREIMEFRFMQTDPNWTNFLYNRDSCRLELLDFGASREYSQDFITKYAQLLAAASRLDRECLRKLSIELGYLTGFESETMLDAHISSILTLAEPFSDSSPALYDFRGQTITDRVRGLIPVMIRERLAPPPEETYSLHRKLSGAFLLCARLGTRVSCRNLLEESLRNINLGQGRTV